MPEQTLAEAIDNADDQWQHGIATEAWQTTVERAALDWFTALLSSPEIQEGAAKVLAKHELSSTWVDATPDTMTIINACTGCPWSSASDGYQGDRHRAHQASVLIAWLAEEVRHG